MTLNLTLDRQSRTPLHLQIAHGIKELILKGAIPEGGRLPPTRKLAAMLGVNRSTVVQAYENLWSEGLVESHVGRGTTVRSAEQGRSAVVSSPPWAMYFSPWAEPEENEIRDLSKLYHREDMISMACGLPGPSLYPMEDISRITTEVLSEEGRSLLQWCCLQGYAPLRQLLAEWEDASPNDILILSGSTQGLYLLARTFIEPGDFVITESPTYLGAIPAFRAAGARIIGIPVDDKGMDLEMLENSLARNQPKFIYTLPTFQNPTGGTLSLDRRRHLLELAYRYRTPVIEDDPYGHLRYEGEPLPSLRQLDTNGYVIRLSTFAKILFPGFRLGWVVAERPVIERLGATKQLLDLFTNSLAQAVTFRLIQSGFLKDHLETICAEYRRRRDAMAGALKRHCPELSFTVPEGGCYFWCGLPRDFSARELLKQGLHQGVSFLTGNAFYPDGRGQDRIRLTFSPLPEDRIKLGIKKLGLALRQVKRKRGRRGARVEAVAGPIV